VEGRRAREALVQDAGQRVAVGTRVDGFAADLFRSEIVERADHLPGVRRGAAELLGDPEVGQVDVAVLIEQDVRRLDVAVDETAAVRGVERARDLGENRDRTIGRELGLAFEHGLQVTPLDVAHGEVELPIVFARLVDRDHVRVVERGRHTRLLQEALAESLVPGELGSDQLERDRALEREIGRSVNDAHAAPPDDGFHAVAREDSPRFHHARHATLPVSDHP
jgi:hypothetical protein